MNTIEALGPTATTRTLLRRWMIEGGQRLPGPDRDDMAVGLAQEQAKAAFVPVQLDAAQSAPTPDIRIEL